MIVIGAALILSLGVSPRSDTHLTPGNVVQEKLVRNARSRPNVPPKRTSKGTPKRSVPVSRPLAQGTAKRIRGPWGTAANYRSRLAQASRQLETVPIGKLRHKQVAIDSLQAQLFYLRQRAYPQDMINVRAYHQAIENVRLSPSIPANVARFQGLWQQVQIGGAPGPFQQFFGTDAVTGRVNGIAFDPRNPGFQGSRGTYYIAAAGGGLWKTTDSGAHWFCISKGPAWQTQDTSCVAIDPLDSQTVYAGTGDVTSVKQVGRGMLKSTDGGATWSAVGVDKFNTKIVDSVLIYPDNSQIVMAATGSTTATGNGDLDPYGFLWISHDAGASWNRAVDRFNISLPIGVWSSLACGQRNVKGVRHCYASALVWSGAAWEAQLWRSDDHGDTWHRILPPLKDDYTHDVAKVAVSALDPDSVYFMAHGSPIKPSQPEDSGKNTPTSGTPQTRIADYVVVSFSPNAGEVSGDTMITPIWSVLKEEEFPSLSEYGIQNYPAFGCGIALQDSRSEDALFLGAEALYRYTTHSGWIDIGKTQSAEALTHSDQRCLAVNPLDPKEVLLGNDGGVYRLQFDPVTDLPEYTSLNRQLVVTQYYSSAISTQDPAVIIGAAQDVSAPIWYRPAPTRIVAANLPLGDGASCLMFPTNQKVQFAAGYFLPEGPVTQDDTPVGELYGTVDGWQTELATNFNSPLAKRCDFKDEPVSFIPPIAQDQCHCNLIYFGTNHVWRLDTKASPRQWSFVGDTTLLTADLKFSNGDPDYGVLQVISIAPGDLGVIYTGSNHGDIFKGEQPSVPTDSFWHSLTGDVTSPADGKLTYSSTGLPRLPITSITVDPYNAHRIYATLAGNGAVPRLWRCDNSLEPKWTSISGPRLKDAPLPTALPDIATNSIVLDPRDPAHTWYVGTDIGVFYTTNGGYQWNSDSMRTLGLPFVQVNKLEYHPESLSLYATTFGRGIWQIKLTP